jgi:hypothetical protein
VHSQPETTAFSPSLKLEIIKLLQNTVHMPAVQVKSLEEGSLSQQGNTLKTSRAARVHDSM